MRFNSIPTVVTRTAQRAIASAAAAITLAASLAACEKFFEPEADDPTVYTVDFRYDLNINGADAFATQVNSVALFVVDDNNNIVTLINDAGAHLAQNNYALTLDVPAGNYNLIAWCGLDSNQNFALDNHDAPQSIDDLVCRLVAQNNASATELAPLWHGMARNVTFPAARGHHNVATINLTKNTNKIRVILQHNSKKTLNPNDFRFTITDDNGAMNYDNTLLASPLITYSAHTTLTAEVTTPNADAASDAADAAASDADITSVSSLIADIDVARLVKGHNPRLTVEMPAEGKTVLSLPVIDLCMLMKTASGSTLSEQEFLDRHDAFTMMFFLQDTNTETNGWYVNAGIYVNEWHVMYQEKNL